MLPWIICLVALAVAMVLHQRKTILTLLQKKGQDSEVFLDGSRKFMILTASIPVSHDTKQLVFAIDHSDQKLGLPVGHHLLIYAPNMKGIIEGKWNNREDHEYEMGEICRKYTPVSRKHQKGTVELIVKEYKRNTYNFIDGGKMSQYLNSLSIGDRVATQGPYGRIEYLGNSEFKIGNRLIKRSYVNLIAGGTGITPVFQLIRFAMENPSDVLQISLIYANKTEDDILLKNDLEQMAQANPAKFSLWYTVESISTKEWTYSKGMINTNTLEAKLYQPSEQVLSGCCGPPPMVNAVKKMLQSIGHDSEDIFSF